MAPQNDAPQSDAARSVLVVDDDPFQRKVLRAWLAASGWEVTEAGTVAEAVERLDAPSISVAVGLVDLRLGDEDGLDVARHLGGAAEADAPALVAMSADMSDVVRERCRDAGFVHTMAKPFQRDNVLEVVRRLAGGAERHSPERHEVPAELRDVPALAALWRVEQTSSEPELIPAVEGLRRAGQLLTSAATDDGPTASRAVAAAAHGLAGAAGILGCTRVEATSKALASKMRGREGQSLDGEIRLLVTVIEAEVDTAVDDLRRKIELAQRSSYQ